MTILHPKATPEHFGLIPFWLHEQDSRDAAAQLGDAYSFAGGWQPFDGFSFNKKTKELSYPEDPPLSPFGVCTLHDKEEVIMYQSGWVCVYNKEAGNVEVCRMD